MLVTQLKREKSAIMNLADCLSSDVRGPDRIGVF